MDLKTILLSIAIGLALASGLFVGFRAGERKAGPPGEPTIQRDTVWRRDTIRIAAPTPKLIRIHDTLWLPAPVPPDTTGHKPDTVYLPVPRQTDYYHGEQYEAWVTGYKAVLDSVRVFQSTAVVEVPVEKIVYKTKRWGIGPQAGITYSPGAGVVPYVGLGIHYNILAF